MTFDLTEVPKKIIDFSSQYSLQKRRAETLETLSTVLKDLRPQCYIAVSVELLRELAEIHLELMSLNLRRLCMTNMSTPKTESKSSPQYFTDLSEEAMRKVKAVADIHLRLNKVSDSLGHGALGDYELSGMAGNNLTQSGDAMHWNLENLFDYFDGSDFNPI